MRVLLFGSNLAGRHGKGAALEAITNWGAVYGFGNGFMCARENAKKGYCYAIPTKDERLRTLPLERIAISVRVWMNFAAIWPHYDFLATRIGCGLAGYSNEDIAPMFVGSPDHCSFDPAWAPWGLKTWTVAP